MKNCIFLFPFLLLCMFLPQSSFGQTTYYISPSTGSDTGNSGTTTQDPFETIGHALGQLDPAVGGSIQLMPGDYYEQILINNFNKLTIEAEGSGDAIIHGSYKDLANDIDANGRTWTLVTTGSDPAIEDSYFNGNLIYKTDVALNTSPNVTNLSFDYKVDWLFRKKTSGEVEQLYGYRYLNAADAGFNGNGDLNQNPEDNGLFFSSRLAYNRNGVGYYIKPHPSDPNLLVLYIAVDPADDFINAGQSQEGLHYSKSGAIIRMGGCSDFELNGGPNKQIKIRYSGRYAIYASGTLANCRFENLDFEDVKNGIFLQASSQSGMVIKNNNFTHLVKKRFDVPYADVKRQIIESSAIVNASSNVANPNPDFSDCLIEGNTISGFFNGIISTFGFTTIANNRLEEVDDDGLEIEGLAEKVRCYGNFLKNVFRGISLVTVEKGPVYFHENVITTNRMVNTFANPNLESQNQAVSDLKPLKFTNSPTLVCANQENYLGTDNVCVSRNCHFYYNTFAMTGVAMTLNMTNQRWTNATESTFYNNIFYSSDGPCTFGAGDHCNGIILRSNLFFAELEQWPQWPSYPNVSTKFSYWGAFGINGTTLSAAETNRQNNLDCMNMPAVTPPDWINNQEQAIDFFNYPSANQREDLHLTSACLNWTLEPLPIDFPPLVNPLRTTPGALEQTCNDECQDAIAVIASSTSDCTNTYSFSTYGATRTLPPGCITDAQSDDDVWFSFVATAPEHIIDISNATEDMTYTVYNACGGRIVSCNGWNGTETLPFVENLFVGHTYYLRIYTRPNNVYSDFDLCIKVPSVPNDECVDAIEVLASNTSSCAQTYSFSTRFATRTVPPSCVNAAQSDDDVWFSFVATAPEHTVEISNATEDMIYVLYNGCGGRIVSCDGWNGTETIDFVENLFVGHTYYLRIYTRPNNVYSDFDLCIKVPSAANDECVDAIDIATSTSSNCSQVHSYSTRFATRTLPPGCISGAQSDDDVWFSFTATANTHKIDITNATEDMIYVVYNACGGNLVSCNGWNGTQTLEVVENLYIGHTYLLRIYTSPANVYSDFDLCISTPSAKSSLPLIHTAGSHLDHPDRPEPTIHPNPASKEFFIQFGWLEGPVSVQITDVNGRLVLYSEYAEAQTSEQMTVDLSTFHEGLYIIKIKDAQRSYTRKLLHIKS
ncbi:MAG: T9SS type A sorting domain-containing protein [Bacteroidota bacterium]